MVVSSSRLLGPADVVLEYNGLDGQIRITALHFEPRPTRLAVHSATYHFELEPEEDRILRRGVLQQAGHAEAGAVLPQPAGTPPRDATLDIGTASIETSNDIFNEVLCQAMADLNMLMTETPQGRYPYAAFPGIRPRSAATD